MQARSKRLAPLALVGGAALALWLAFGHGYVNYDSFYSLLWGNELFHGHAPDYTAPLAPTPHPLATLFGLLAAPLGSGAADALLVVAFLTLGAIAYLVYRLGELWVNRWVGLLAVLLVLTRIPVLDYGSRAYVDLQYVAFVLGALLVETRSPRERPVAVLVLLGLAGLLRPEAWLFSGVYLVYLAYAHPQRPDGWLAPLALLVRPSGLLRLSALAAAAPVAWAAYDLAVSGDPFYSLTATQNTVTAVHHRTGLGEAIRVGPRRLEEVDRVPVLFAAAGGLALTVGLTRRRVAIGAAAVGVALGAFLLLAAAGLDLLTRYLLLPGTLVAIFGAAGALGWLSLDRGNPWRLRWAAFGAVAILAMLAYGPQQASRLRDLRTRIADQERIHSDLHRLVDSSAFDRACLPLRASDTQAVPLLALWLGLRPTTVAVSDQVPARGYLVEPSDPRLATLFALDPNLPFGAGVRPPAGVAPTASNRSWLAFGGCGARR